MKTFTRRQFIGTSAMGLLAAAYFPSCASDRNANPFGWPLSFQSYGVKDLLAVDFEGTLRKLHTIGFEGVEMCSPKGYQDPGFANLKTLTAAGLKEKIQAAGLFCKSCHFQHPEIKSTALQETIGFSKDLGLKNIVVSAAWLPENATLDDWKKFVEEMNLAGDEIRKSGMQLAYHNHSIGPVIEGEQLYDVLMKLFDPELVKMQFQIACVSEGFDVVNYIGKYPGRYISLHIHDWDPNSRQIVALGKGVVDWKKLLTTAKGSGVADYGLILELETRSPGDPMQDLVDSYNYLRTINLKSS
jgi:sugar phosphate isomerase/epimerase